MIYLIGERRAAGHQPGARERGVGWVVLHRIGDRLAACPVLIHQRLVAKQAKKVLLSCFFFTNTTIAINHLLTLSVFVNGAQDALPSVNP